MKKKVAPKEYILGVYLRRAEKQLISASNTSNASNATDV